MRSNQTDLKKKRGNGCNNQVTIDSLLQSVLLRPSKQMAHPEERYYKLNRFLLSVSGLWPYQSEWSARLMRTVTMTVTLSSVIAQLSSVLPTCFSQSGIFTIEFIVDAMPTLLVTIGALINLYLRIVYIDEFRELFERMWKDWALQKTHDEFKIMHKHAETSRLFTFCYCILVCISVATYIIWLFIPEILDIMSPMNESRPRSQPFNLEFFIDEERYFYFIQSHTCMVILIITVIYVASSTLFLIVTQHVCGMYELLGYRAERLFCVVEDEAECDLIQRSQISCRNVAVFVRQHNNIIQFGDIIETCYTMQFLIDFIGIVIGMSLTLIQILTISGMEQAFRSIAVMVLGLLYVFVPCYMGQRLTDVSSSICEKIFNSMWYNAVVSEQKTLIIIMMQRYHPLILTACKFCVMSLQNFEMILQTSISYCMFVRQI